MKKVLCVVVVVFLSSLAWAEDVDILTKIHTVFQGEHTRESIKEALDESLSLYGLERSDKNYEQVASMVLNLRKNNDVPEMEILACMNELPKGDYAVQFEATQSAALCATMLALNPPKVSLVAQLHTRIVQLEDLIKELETQLAARPVAEAKPKPKVLSDIPVDIDQIIRKQAAERFPDDNSTQLYLIKQEREAWQELQTYTSDIPEVELEKIVRQAEERFVHDYSTQIFFIKQEVDAYKDLHQQDQQTAAQYMAAYAPLQTKLQKLEDLAGPGQYGWFVKPCNQTLCGEQPGYLVAFRASTGIGVVVPIWFVSKELTERGWVNGKAKGFTPDLPQAIVPDIGATFNTFKKMPSSSAITTKK